MKVFVDTGAWIGRHIKSDLYNFAAKKAYAYYKNARALFYTNDYVLDEVYTRLIYDVHLKAAQKFHEQIKSALNKRQLVLLDVGDKDRKQAWQILDKYAEHRLSFTDATIVTQFIELNLDEIFTFDSHFRDIRLPTNFENTGRY